LSECFNADGLIAEAEHKNKLNESALFVADADNKVIGIIKVTAGTNGLGVLDYIGVDPEYHAHGTGSRLMQRAEEFWREHKQRKITTCVSAHNKKALLYYIKNDFVPEGYCKDHFHPGIDEIILGRFMKY
jgi:ribosomal protein S18 acetylase RimI-like enzyme